MEKVETSKKNKVWSLLRRRQMLMLEVVRGGAEGMGCAERPSLWPSFANAVIPFVGLLFLQQCLFVFFWRVEAPPKESAKQILIGEKKKAKKTKTSLWEQFLSRIALPIFFVFVFH